MKKNVIVHTGIHYSLSSSGLYKNEWEILIVDCSDNFDMISIIVLTKKCLIVHKFIP